MSILILYENKEYGQEIKYTFEVMFSSFDVKYDILSLDEIQGIENYSLLIFYGKEKVKFDTPAYQIYISETSIFWNNYFKKEALPIRPLKVYNKEESIPVIFWGHLLQEDPIIVLDSKVITNIDIISSSFFLLSRYEEVLSQKRDHRNRFNAENSLAYQEGFLEKPVVNEYIELLWSWIKKLRPEFTRKKLWKGKEYAFFLSHDIDHLYKYPGEIRSKVNGFKRVLGHIVKRRDFKKAILTFKEICFNIFNGYDPYFNFDKMINMERLYEIKSSWYFMSNKSITDDGQKYSLKEVQDLIKRLEDHGHEVGIHLSYNTYNHLDNAKKDLEIFESKLNQKPLGLRQHFLRFDINNTWRIQEHCGFLYDSTLGYADRIGFRSSYCYPYKPYDFKNRKAYDLWEIPLLVMDGTLKQYMGLKTTDAIKRVGNVIEQVKKYQGVFSMLWHNSSFGAEWDGWDIVYQSILNEVCNDLTLAENGKNIINIFNN